MSEDVQQIRQDLTKYATDFQIESIPFQKVVIIENYLDYLHNCRYFKNIMPDQEEEDKKVTKILMTPIGQGKELLEKRNSEIIKDMSFIEPDTAFGDNPEDPFKQLRELQR